MTLGDGGIVAAIVFGLLGAIKVLADWWSKRSEKRAISATNYAVLASSVKTAVDRISKIEGRVDKIESYDGPLAEMNSHEEKLEDHDKAIGEVRETASAAHASAKSAHKRIDDVMNRPGKG